MADEGLGEYFAEQVSGIGGDLGVLGTPQQDPSVYKPEVEPYAAEAGIGDAGPGLGNGAAGPIQEPYEASAGYGAIGPYPDYASANGVGGNGTAWKLAASISPAVNGLGQAADVLNAKQSQQMSPGAAAGAMLGVLVGSALWFGGGYLAGKAMAPDEQSETAYAWAGGLSGFFFGNIGLGATAIVALRGRR